jgi:hypothetical protein
MQCKCGYSFSREAAKRPRKFESYAVVRDRDYPALIKSEMRVLRASGEDAKLRAIARSSKYVGCLLECPKCSRLLLLKPGADDSVIYLREEKSRRKT